MRQEVYKRKGRKIGYGILLYCNFFYNQYEKEEKYMAREKFKNLTYRNRIEMETMLKNGSKIIEVAKYLKVHRSTIYREYKRGLLEKMNSDLTKKIVYDADQGQRVANWNKQATGRTIKLGNDIKLANFIEDRICDDKYSPAATVALIKKQSTNFTVTVCTRTIYRYIDNGIFFRLTNKDLPQRGIRKNKVKHKKIRRQRRASAGTSIEKRPQDVDNRNQFGHWEMDTVKGSRGLTKSCLLVLTERKTRQEIIIKLKNQGSSEVVKALDRLEKKFGNLFYNIFKSITVDNGQEFSDCDGMERSIIEKNKQRTYLFYCHAYCSWERGSNENNNKLIRRHIPKGKDLDPIFDDEIEYITKWMNAYPRGIFDFKSSQELFDEELLLLA